MTSGRGGRYFFARMARGPGGDPGLKSTSPLSSLSPVSTVPVLTPPPTRPRRSRVGCAGAMLAAVVVLALLTAFLWQRLERAARDTAGRLRDAVAAVARVQPRVVVNDRVVFEQSTPALELAVVRHVAEVDREFTATWLGSTKRLRLRGTYEVRAGYDLRGQPFTVRVDRAAVPGGWETLRVELPPARLLGVEQRQVEVLEMRNGMWNKLAPGELTDELNALAAQARAKAAELNLPREAQENLTRQLRERLGDGGRAVEIVTVPAAEATPAP